jgi:hypothetical protein
VGHHGQKTTPVIMAGLSFGALALALLPIGHLVSSSAIFALGLEAAFDGVFFILGGTASRLLQRSERHVLWCYTRESVELVALGSGVFFTLGLFLQPSTDTSSAQGLAGVVGAVIAVGLAVFWHRRLDEHHHHGFDAHMRADAAVAASVALASIAAAITGQPRVSFWGALVGAVVGLGFSAAAARRIIRRLWHPPSKHPTGHVGHAHH